LDLERFTNYLLFKNVEIYLARGNLTPCFYLNILIYCDVI
jgi:hypothetical protein